MRLGLRIHARRFHERGMLCHTLSTRRPERATKRRLDIFPGLAPPRRRRRFTISRRAIRDVVLIEAIDLDFTDGLGVLTGETGAGKSILLEALGFLLGARGSAEAGACAGSRRRRSVGCNHLGGLRREGS